MDAADGACSYRGLQRPGQADWHVHWGGWAWSCFPRPRGPRSHGGHGLDAGNNHGNHGNNHGNNHGGIDRSGHRAIDPSHHTPSQPLSSFVLLFLPPSSDPFSLLLLPLFRPSPFPTTSLDCPSLSAASFMCRLFHVSNPSFLSFLDSHIAQALLAARCPSLAPVFTRPLHLFSSSASLLPIYLTATRSPSRLHPFLLPLRPSDFGLHRPASPPCAPS